MSVVASILVKYLPIEVLKVVESFNIKYNKIKHTPQNLIRTGNLDGLKWLYVFKRELLDNPEIKVDFVKLAVIYDQLEILKWLYENHICTLDHCTFDLAAERGNLDMVEFLHFNGVSCTTVAMNKASEYGHKLIVKFLHYNRSEGCTTDAMDLAAANGHIDIVKFLHYNRSEGCTTDAMDFASAYNFLDIVKFLHYNRLEGCTIDALSFAIECGSFETTKFLYINRRERYRHSALEFAKSYKYYNIVNWINFRNYYKL